MNGNLPRQKPAASSCFQLSQSFQSNWQRRGPKLFPKQARTALERLRRSVVRPASLWKDDYAVAVIHGFSGVAKAAAKSAELRQRKDVEESGHDPVLQRSKQVQEPVPLVSGKAPVENHLTGHCHRHSAPDAAGKRVQDEGYVVRR